MVAYIIGLIVGAVCLLFPLIYAMFADACRAAIWARNPELTQMPFTPYCPEWLLYGTAVIGAVVVLLSAAMIAKTGLHQFKPHSENAGPSKPIIEEGEQPHPDTL